MFFIKFIDKVVTIISLAKNGGTVFSCTNFSCARNTAQYCRFIGTIILAISFIPSAVHALQLNELVVERDGNELRGRILVDDIQRAQRDLRVSIPTLADYEAQGISYNNFIRDLEIMYRSSNRRSGRITITFPYEPIERFDLLVEVKWPAGEVQRTYKVELAGILPQQDGSVIARITPSDVPVRRSSSFSSDLLKPPVSNIETVEGDSWHNLAQAIRQAYLRDQRISQEQVMLALRDKNKESFIGGRKIRIGVALNLPTYYEVEAVGQRQAEQELYRVLRQVSRPSPRLEIVAASSAGKSDSLVSQDSQPPQNEGAKIAGQEEKLDIQKREVVDKVERLSLVRKQLDQVEKLLGLKSTELFALQNEVDYQEGLPKNDYDFDQINTTANTVEKLLEVRWQVLRREFSTRPIFWFALVLSTLVVFIFLSWLMLIHNKSRKRRTRLRMMGDLRKGNVTQGSSSRPLIFEEAGEDLSIPERLASSVPETVSKPKRKPSSRGDGFVQDNLTNANLDLARAYINMGEVASAKSLLDEVASTGTADEKTQARRLLEEI